MSKDCRSVNFHSHHHEPNMFELQIASDFEQETLRSFGVLPFVANLPV
jgi:hypothetical protein